MQGKLIRRRLGAGLIGIFIILSTGIPTSIAQTAACNNTAFNVGLGGNAVTSMAIQSGASCNAAFYVMSGTIASMEIEKPASHGTARAARNAWGYTSKAGYTGPDSFSFRIRRGGRQLDSVVTVQVTVTP